MTIVTSFAEQLEDTLGSDASATPDAIEATELFGSFRRLVRRMCGRVRAVRLDAP